MMSIKDVMEMRPASKILPGWSPFLALVLFLLPLYTLGFPQGHDWIFELVRVAEFKSAMISGQLPPYWAEDLYGGYGSPIFLFYAPLDAFTSSICSFFTGSITTGCICAIMLFSMIAILSIQQLLQSCFDNETCSVKAASRIAACFFILNPYLICDVYFRNANAEFAALCVAPIAINGLLMISRKPRTGGLMLASGLALTITAHNLTALIIFALVITLVLGIYIPTKRISVWITIIGSLVLGLGLSAFFWVPAIYYKSLVRIDQMVRGKLDFHHHFQPMTALFSYDFCFSVGLLTPFISFIALAIIVVKSYKKELISLRLLALLFFISLLFLFLQSRASMHIWDTVAYLPLFQFPWRMMGPLALVTSMVAGLSFAHLFKEKPSRIVFRGEALVLFFCIMNAMPHLEECKPLPEFVSRQLPYLLRAETIRYQGLRATVADEYLPQSAKPESYPRPWMLDRTSYKPNTQILKDSGTQISMAAKTEDPSRLSIPRWFFPGWQYTVNGELQRVGMNNSGSIDISVPAGSPLINLQLREPVMRRVCLWISLLSLSVWIVILLLPLDRKGRPARSHNCVLEEQVDSQGLAE